MSLWVQCLDTAGWQVLVVGSATVSSVTAVNPEWFNIVVPAYSDCPGIMVVRRVFLLVMYTVCLGGISFHFFIACLHMLMHAYCCGKSFHSSRAGTE